MDAKDLQIDTYTAGAVGVGPYPYRAVRITHIPSGYIASREGKGSLLGYKEQCIRELEDRVGDIGSRGPVLDP